MTMNKRVMLGAALLIGAVWPLAADAQGIGRGAAEGASVGHRAAGPVGGAVGAVVGGVTGGVVGGVKGILGVPQNTAVPRHRVRRRARAYR